MAFRGSPQPRSALGGEAQILLSTEWEPWELSSEDCGPGQQGHRVNKVMYGSGMCRIHAIILQTEAWPALPPPLSASLLTPEWPGSATLNRAVDSTT